MKSSWFVMGALSLCVGLGGAVACGGTTPEPQAPESEGEAAAPTERVDPGAYVPVTGDAPSVEKDQAAILAMAGTFDVVFDFKETLALRPGYKLHKGHESKALELVEVVTNEPGYVVLQHILITDDDGKSMVIKHWRQDWRYEDNKILSYRGKWVWENEELPAEKVKGTWSQAVYQVDDSPRYESYGRWYHRGNVAYWESEETWRPLPRREHTVRQDYHVIVGKNRHEITPLGWVHHQDNYKLDLDDKSGSPMLARELGFNRYTRKEDVGFGAGRAFWQKHQAFFVDVRAAWDRVLNSQQFIQLETNPGGIPLWMKLLKIAEKAPSPYSQGASAKEIDAMVEASLVNKDAGAAGEKSASR